MLASNGRFFRLQDRQGFFEDALPAERLLKIPVDLLVERTDHSRQAPVFSQADDKHYLLAGIFVQVQNQ